MVIPGSGSLKVTSLLKVRLEFASDVMPLAFTVERKFPWVMFSLSIPPLIVIRPTCVVSPTAPLNVAVPLATPEARVRIRLNDPSNVPPKSIIFPAEFRVVFAISTVVPANMEPDVADPVFIVPPSCRAEGAIVPLPSALKPSVKVVVTLSAPIVTVPEFKNVTRFAIDPPPRMLRE